MPFTKGNQLAKARTKKAGGRKTNETKAKEKLASERAKHRLDKHVDDYMEMYHCLGTGMGNEEILKRASLVNPVILKDAVSKWIAAAKQELELNGEVKVIRLMVPDLNG